MSAMDRLHALEQLVVMQGEVPLVRTAAAQAEERARVLGVRSEGVVDTRSWGNQGASMMSRTTGDSPSSRSWATFAQLMRDPSKR